MSNFQIDINEFSNGQINNSNTQEPKWEGTGIFDVIIKAANENIKIQHKTSRITGAEYAEVYLGTMQSAISEAMKFLLVKEITEKDIAIKDVEIVNSITNGENLIKQGVLLEKDAELRDVTIVNSRTEGDNLIKSGKLLDQQKKIAYVERVIKDKEAAALGMDKVVKVANTAATTEAVYIPKYEEA